MGEEPPSTEPHEKQESSSENSTSFWAELKRRRVTRVGITYAVVAWLLIQVAATVFPQLDLPDWAPRMVTLLLLIGFPIALIITWAFELTPEGIKTTKAANASRSAAEDSKGYALKRNGIAIAFAAALPTVVFGTLALIFYIGKSDQPSDTSPVYNPDRPHFMGSLAALPIQVISGEDTISSFAEGLHDEFLTQVSGMSTFDVVSRTSTLAYREPSKSVFEIGEALNARYVIESSIQEVGSQWRLTVQIIEAASDLHLDAKTYDKEFGDKDLLYLQKELAWDVAFDVYERLREENPFSEKALAAHNAQIDSKITEMESLQDTIDGEKDRSKQGPMRGSLISLVEQTLSIDPGNSSAHRINLANMLMRLRMLGLKESSIAELRLVVHRALRFVSDDHETLAQAGMFYLMGLRRPDQALPLLQDSLRLYESNPNRVLRNDLYNQVALAMRLTGNDAGGLKLLERAPSEHRHWDIMSNWIPL